MWEVLNAGSRWKKGLILAPNSGDGSLMQDLEATDPIHGQEQRERERVHVCLPVLRSLSTYIECSTQTQGLVYQLAIKMTPLPANRHDYRPT